MYSPFKKYGYFWVTLALFLFSLAGHWVLAWYSYVTEQRAHNQDIEIQDYVVETGRDMFENWQSEFLQLMWQVGGLALLLHVGSPQSREGDERKEAKLDHIIRTLDVRHGEEHIRKIDKKFLRAK